MLLSAIILNYRTGRTAWKCVEALQKQTIADKMEILLVDNHSNDDSIGYLHNHVRDTKDVRIIETPTNLGYGQGNTFAIRYATGEFLLIINPDNELEPRGAEQMIRSMQEHPDIGILAPMLVQEDGTIRTSSRTFPTPWDVFLKRTFLRRFFPKRVDRYLQQSEDPHAIRDVDWVVGACMLIRRSLYEELRGFDPRFFLFFEDTDLCRRAHAAGKRVVYFPTVRATDRKHRLSEGGILTFFTKKTVRIHLWSALKYFWKWRKPV